MVSNPSTNEVMNMANYPASMVLEWTLPWDEEELSLEPMQPTARTIDFDDIPESMEPIGALLVADYEC
jgi:hypothetical protein|nr:MAG TPA: hypothetical protein [Caudoviricetes sp.]